MRKVSSAPSLHELGRKNAEQPGGARPLKQPSTLARRPTGAKPRNVSTGSLPLLLQHALEPPDLTELEEFSESARGLAGLDCYEKYGHQQTSAPALRDSDDTELFGRALVAQRAQQDEDDQAFASCLATPYTADERNLGEEVEAAARQKLQAAEEDLNGRFRASVDLPRKEHLSRVEDDNARKSPHKRKRRFLESLGLRKQTSQVPSDTIFEDNDLAEAYLTAQAGLESEDNRILLPDDWACNEEICHPLVAADENLFKRQLRPQRLSMRDQNHLSRAQSVQHW